MYDGSPEERKAIRAEHLEGPANFNVLLTHYDLIIRDKSLLRKVPNFFPYANALLVQPAHGGNTVSPACPGVPGCCTRQVGAASHTCCGVSRCAFLRLLSVPCLSAAHLQARASVRRRVHAASHTGPFVETCTAVQSK